MRRRRPAPPAPKRHPRGAARNADASHAPTCSDPQIFRSPDLVVVAARFLALIDPRLYDFGRADLGQFARMGLGRLASMDAKRAREFSTTRSKFKEADALFAQLCSQLPVSNVVASFNRTERIARNGIIGSRIACQTSSIYFNAEPQALRGHANVITDSQAQVRALRIRDC